MTTALKLDSSEMQRVARDFVHENVYCNIGTLMEYAIQKSIEDSDAPVSYDEIGFEVDPSDWDAAKLKAYIEDELSATWEDATGETWPEANSKEEIKAARSHITENSERQTRIDFGEGPVKEWDEDTMRRFVEEQMGDDWADIVGHRFPETEIEEDEIDKARDYIRDNAERREVYEWWAVSQWLAERLKERGYIVVDEMGGGLYVWGRETTGQAIYMDYAIQEITNDWRARYGHA